MAIKNYMMKHYEYTYLTRQDMAEEEAKNLLDKLTESITAKNGTITDLPKAYKKRLVYRIAKQDAAFVNTILFQMEPSPLDEFKKESSIIAEILRGLIISYDPEKLKREIRPEINKTESSSVETPIAAETAATEIAKPEPVKTEFETIKEEPRAEKEGTKEEKQDESAKVAPKEEAKEEKPKPKRKAKIKTELRDIEQKLDEILK